MGLHHDFAATSREYAAAPPPAPEPLAPARPGGPLLILLMGLSALAECSTQLVLPGMPSAARALGASPAAVQASFLAFIVALGLSQLVVGPLSDRFGRKPLLLAGLALYVGATIAASGVTSAEQLVAIRALQGVGACAGVVVARAIARDRWGPAAPVAMALMLFGMMVALMLAPALGGLAATLGGWRAGFWLAAALGGLALGAVALGYRETAPTAAPGASHPARLLAAYKEIAGHRGFLANALTLGCTYGVLFAYVAGSSFVLIGHYGLTQAQYGGSFALVLTGLVAGTLGASRWVPRVGPQRLVRLGTGLVLTGAALDLAGVAVPGVPLIALLGPQLLATFGAGLVLPSAVAGAVMPFGQRAGLASGLVGFAQMALGAGFGLALGALPGGSAIAMVGVQTVAAVLAFGVFRLVSPKARLDAVGST